MTNHARRLVPIVLCVAAVAGVAVAGTSPSEKTDGAIRLTFAVDSPAFEHAVPSVVAIVAAPGSSFSATTGARMPIATRSAPDEGATDNDGVRFSYQSVGLSINGRIRDSDDGRLLVSGGLEVSGLAAGFTPGDLESPPVLLSSSSTFEVTLADGGSERIVREAGPDGDRLVVDLRVELLE